jgi:hypothetical protein
MGAGMGRFRRWMILAGLAALLAPAQALADAKDGVFNKEHVWAIDVDHGACAASRTLDDGSVFLFRAQEGQLTFGFFSRSPLKAGKAGRLETEASATAGRASISTGTSTPGRSRPFAWRAT